MKKILLLGGVYICSFLGLLAQENSVVIERDTIRSIVEKEVEVSNPYVAYVPYAWNEGWFFQLGAGAQVYWNKGINKGAFGDNISPVFQFSAAKWLYPYMGIRFQIQGLWQSGNTQYSGWYTSNEPNSKGGYRYSAPYNNFHFDILWNVTQSFYAKDKPAVYSLIPFAGVGLSGYYFSESQKDLFVRNNVLAIHLGILNKFRLNDNWSLFAELQVVAQNWSPNPKNPEGLFGAGAYGFQTPLSIGVTYTIGKPARNKRLKGVAAVDMTLARETITRTQVVEKEVVRIVEVQPSDTLRSGQPFFSIHVLYGQNRRLESPIFKGQKPVIKIPDAGKFHYFIGEFKTKEEVDEAMLEAKKVFKKPYPVVILNRKFSPFLAK